MKRSMLETPRISSSTIAFVLSNLTLTSFGLNSKTPPLYTSYPVTNTPPINALPTAPTAPAPTLAHLDCRFSRPPPAVRGSGLAGRRLGCGLYRISVERHKFLVDFSGTP